MKNNEFSGDMNIKTKKLSAKGYLLAVAFLMVCAFVMSLTGYFSVLVATPLAVVTLTVIFLFSGSVFKSVVPVLISAAISVISVVFFGAFPVESVAALAFVPIAIMATVALKNQFKMIEMICFISAVSVFIICVCAYGHLAFVLDTFDAQSIFEYVSERINVLSEEMAISYSELQSEVSDIYGGNSYLNGIYSDSADQSTFDASFFKMALYTTLAIVPALAVIVSNIVAFIISVFFKFLSEQYPPLCVVSAQWKFHIGAFSAIVYLISNLCYIFSVLFSNDSIYESPFAIVSANVYAVLSVSFFVFGALMIPRLLGEIKKRGKIPVSPFFLVILLVFCVFSPGSLFSLAISLVTYFGVSVSIGSAIVNMRRNRDIDSH